MNDAAKDHAGAHDLPSVVKHALEHTSHLLPDQAPIRVFIHHNTLHAFQHLHFHDAVLKAREVYGAEPYMSEERYREKMAVSRIELCDLEAALDDQLPGNDAVFLEGLVDVRAVRLAMLRFAIPSETAATLNWRMRERDLTRRMRDDAPEEARERLLAESERWLRLLLEGKDAEAALRFGRVVTGYKQASEVEAALSESFATPLEPRELLRALDDDSEAFVLSALWHACDELAQGYQRPQKGRGEHFKLHRDALLERTGHDVYDLVFPVLIRETAAYLDDGLAYWSMPDREQGFYPAVRKLVAEGSGLPMRWVTAARRDFAAQLARNASAMDAVLEALDELGVDADHAEHYIEALLLTLPGWAGMMGRLERHPDDRPQGGPPASLLDFLAVRLTYERAALREAAAELGPRVTLRDVWKLALATREPNEPRAPQDATYRLFQMMQLLGVPVPAVRNLRREDAHEILALMDSFDELWRRRVLQEAFEHHHRTQVLDALAAHRPHTKLSPPKSRPKAQVVCCFDEREESFRRQLEEVDGECQTFGAPGFFGAAMRFRALDEPHHVPLAPVVIKPTHHIEERARSTDADLDQARLKRRRFWASAAHNVYTGSRSLWRGMLVNTALGMLAAFPLLVRIVSPRVAGRIRRFASEMLLPSPRTELTVHHDEACDTQTPRGFKVDERVARVATVLENIGFTKVFSKVVIVLGHGATTLNNPHKSAYDCGACGGRQGGPNARVFAHMANDPVVRKGLAERGIHIPDDTYFVGGQHDTCSDFVTLFDTESVPESHKPLFAEAVRIIDEARARTAQERCRRLFSAPRNATPQEALAHVEGRSEHLAEPRPEFGHATNAVAVVGRRGLTRGLFLDRRAFLLSYDPTIDPEGTILERTLAAATPVGAGINLEYYFSHVDNERYGAGSKLPHNIVGLIGVMSGHASDLRTGLPRQMIEIHEAVRLLVIVEATPERLLAIAGKQAEVRELVVNRWVQLVSLDPDTGAMHVFTDRGFVPYAPSPVKLPEAPSSRDFYHGHTDFLPPARIVGPRARAA